MIWEKIVILSIQWELCFIFIKMTIFVLSSCVEPMYWFSMGNGKGVYHLQDLSISRVINHVTCKKFDCGWNDSNHTGENISTNEFML